jgi:hypothetical protein
MGVAQVAGGHQIRVMVLTPEASGDHVVQGQARGHGATPDACMVIPVVDALPGSPAYPSAPLARIARPLAPSGIATGVAGAAVVTVAAGLTGAPGHPGSGVLATVRVYLRLKLQSHWWMGWRRSVGISQSPFSRTNYMLIKNRSPRGNKKTMLKYPLTTIATPPIPY